MTGSAIGGTQCTRDMLEFCGKHNVMPDTTVIEAKDIDMAYEKLAKNSAAGARFVIDI